VRGDGISIVELTQKLVQDFMDDRITADEFIAEMDGLCRKIEGVSP